MNSVRVLVGTRKGTFVLSSGAQSPTQASGSTGSLNTATCSAIPCR